MKKIIRILAISSICTALPLSTLAAENKTANQEHNAGTVAAFEKGKKYTVKIMRSVVDQDGKLGEESTMVEYDLSSQNTGKYNLRVEIAAVAGKGPLLEGSDSLDKKKAKLYGFDVEKGKTYTLDIKNHKTSYNTLQYKIGVADDDDIYTDNGYKTTSKGKITSYQFQARTSGQAILKVYSGYPGEAFDYTITVLPSTSDGLIHNKNSYEPNNSIATAAPIQIGDSLNLSLEGGDSDPQDYYSFNVEKGKTYTLDIKNHKTSYNTLQYKIGVADDDDIYTDNGYKTTSKGKITSYQFQARTSGQAILKVYSGYPSEAFDYTVSIK